MLEIKFVSQNLSSVKRALDARGQQIDLETFKRRDDERRVILQEIESLRHQRNVVSDRIAEMKKAAENTESLVLEMRTVSTKIKELDKQLSENQTTINDILLGIPNIPHASVPIGADEADNPLVRTAGQPPEFNFDPQPHWEIGTRLNILDFDRAAKITGARFPLYFGTGARRNAP
jgi:seryl-tRNA synthetase